MNVIPRNTQKCYRRATSVTPWSFVHILLRHNANEALADTGEGDFVLDGIRQCLTDARSAYRGRGRIWNPQLVEPCRAFSDGRIDRLAGLVGLDPAFVRESVAKVWPWIFVASTRQ